MSPTPLHARPAGLPEAVRWCGWHAQGGLPSAGWTCPGCASGATRPATTGVRRPKAGSDTEALLASQLAAAGYFDTTFCESRDLPTCDCFRRAVPWGLALNPERGFTADVAFLGPRLLVEVKGLSHAAGRKKVRADVEREGLAVSLGWRVLPLTPESVRDGSAIALIARALTPAPVGGKETK